MTNAHERASWQKAVHDELYERVPCNIAVIDRSMRIVDHNKNFSDIFGEGIGKPCYTVYKRRSAPCPDCMTLKTFQDGEVRVNDAEGVDKDGRPAHYVVHIVPVKLPNGEIPYVIEMSTDVTDTRRLQREYHILFERVPCYVAVLNKDLRIVRANERLRETFGKTTGEHCFEVMKKRAEKCESCPALQTFDDGQVHTSEHVGISKSGERTHYIVTTSPLSKTASEVSHVIEVALDISETRRLESELEKENAFREVLIRNSVDAIIGVDTESKVFLFNPAAEKLTGYSAEKMTGQSLPRGLFAGEFDEIIEGGRERYLLSDARLTASDGEAIPVQFNGVTLRQNGDRIGAAAFVQDLRKIRQLEKEKIDAERLAAVGQTVAGLAHGIKNILTGLEGGMYVFRGGLEKSDQSRIDRGWEMLERNIDRVTILARSLLSFSKGDPPAVSMVDPVKLALEVVDLYADAAHKAKVELELDAPEPVDWAPMDREGMHSCLANLVSNAIDACQMGDKPNCKVTVRCREEGDTLLYEVADEGCGMNYEIKKKVFTNFFTTKGAVGTGIGLLITRKIVQEHGGTITFESAPEKGTLFRLLFRRDRLPLPSDDDSERRTQ